uniref:Protein FMC1 homolog n=1 Tax=Lepeophtheirus salmonis TaxID=72036 RepID=A0A0K2UAB8_LEPSM
MTSMFFNLSRNCSSSSKSSFKSLFRELERAGVQNVQTHAYIKEVYKKYFETSKQYCRAGEEMNHFADTFTTYLRSLREWNNVRLEFHAKGERSVEETARLVGFKLPHDPK